MRNMYGRNISTNPSCDSYVSIILIVIFCSNLLKDSTIVYDDTDGCMYGKSSTLSIQSFQYYENVVSTKTNSTQICTTLVSKFTRASFRVYTENYSQKFYTNTYYIGFKVCTRVLEYTQKTQYWYKNKIQQHTG